MANYLKGIGDASQRINEILPSLDARIYNFLEGHTAGIIKSEFYEFSASTIDRGVIVKSGLMQAHGYFGCCDTDTQINFVMPSTTQYCHLYAEIDLSVVPNKFAIKATALSNTTSYSFRQDNLRSTTNGKYQLHLWQATLTSSTITLTDKRGYIHKPLNAVNAEFATKATDATNATNVVAGGTVNTSTVTAQTVTTTAAGSSFYRGYTIPDNSIPSSRVSTTANFTGNGSTLVQQSGTLSAGWYDVELAGGGGGRGGNNGSGGGAGGTSGALSTKFFVPFSVTYFLTAGGAGGNGGDTSGNYNAGSGGGGGGASVLNIPQLGILLTATGGGGGSGRSSSGGMGGIAVGGSGGNGGGFGAGGAGGEGANTSPGSAGAGSNYLYTTITIAGGAANSSSSIVNPGATGKNNFNFNSGGGVAASTNGYARLYKLG